MTDKPWRKRRIKTHSKVGKIPLSEIEAAVKVVTGAKHYGLPENAKERLIKVN